MDAESLENARLDYIGQREKYEEFVREVIEKIRRGAALKGLSCQIEGRTKDVGSFMKKVLHHQFENPLHDVKDKAGVRLILLHDGDRTAAREVAESCFPNVVWESSDWSEERPANMLEYPRYHLQIRDDYASERLGIQAECEIQIRSEAAHLWSRLSHRFLYKAGRKPPTNVARTLLRLLALVEIYDSEVQRAISSIVSDSDFQVASILSRAEDEYLAFCTSSFSRDLSADVIAVLTDTMDRDQLSLYPYELGAFIDGNRDKLEGVYKEYGPASAAGKSGMFVLASQPESVVFFERIENARFSLEDSWERSELPDEMFKDMRDIWG